jgi:bacterioferritin
MTRDRQIQGLIARLNDDLARKLANVIRYNYQAAKAAGPSAETMRQLLRDEAASELEHAAVLSEVIVGLGGEPTTTPVEFDKPYCQKMALELDVLLEEADVRRTLEHARIAAALEERELQSRLEAIAEAEAHHARDLARLLASLWPASAGVTH